MIGRISKVRKRDGRLVDFDESKIADAVFKAACAVGDGDRFLAEELAGVVTLFLEKSYSGSVPGIEEIQDMVEKVLIETGHARMAKAYILYRERRARAREQVHVQAEGGAGPLVGSPARARVSHWSKGRIAEALVREADLDRKVAGKVAARVEEKVFQSGVKRISTTAIRSLVEAELFLQGFGDRVGRQSLVGLPRFDVDRLVRGGKGAEWRPSGPRDLKRAVADAVLSQYALSEVYSSEVTDAHLEARLHIADVGCPFEWIAAVARVPDATEADAWVESAALLAGRLGQVVTRELTLTGLASSAGGWRDGGGALSAARRLLGHSALRTLDQRGGRFRLVLSLPRLGGPDLAEAIVREHWARFRSGALEGLPELVLHVAASKIGEAEGRRALLSALAAAAETGRVRIVLDREDPASLVTPCYRIPAGEPPGSAALPVAGAVSINVAALAMERPGDEEAALLEALDGAIVLALKALRQKRSFLGSLQADPAGSLYRIAAGPRRIVAGDAGVDLIHLVGLTEAARRLAGGPEETSRLSGRLRSYGAVRVAEEGRKARLRVCSAAERDGEAARRFHEADRRRFEGLESTGSAAYIDGSPYPLAAEAGLGSVTGYHDPVSETLDLRFARDEAPAPEALYDALHRLARDPRVGVVRLSPWPDRSVHAALADL